MKQLIAQLKRNIYEVNCDREKHVKDINQAKKIYTNLQNMKETAQQDADKLKADF